MCSQTPASAAALAITSCVGPVRGSASSSNAVYAKAPTGHSSGSTTRSAPRWATTREAARCLRDSTGSSGSTAIWMREARTLPPSWHSSRQHGPTIVTRKHCRGACSQRNLATEPHRRSQPAARPSAPSCPCTAEPHEGSRDRPSQPPDLRRRLDPLHRVDSRAGEPAHRGGVERPYALPQLVRARHRVAHHRHGVRTARRPAADPHPAARPLPRAERLRPLHGDAGRRQAPPHRAGDDLRAGVHDHSPLPAAAQRDA